MNFVDMEVNLIILDCGWYMY